MPAERTVAVVGGGIAGLVAARDLALAGLSVDLFEESDRLGGRIASCELDGARFDIGAEAFATRGGSVERLVAELGLAERIVRPAPLGSWLVSTGGAATPLPPAGTLGIPAAPLGAESRAAIGLGGALRAALEPLLPRRTGRGAGSLGALVRARLGSRVLDRLVRPVCLGVYAADPDSLPPGAVPGLAAAFERRGSLLTAARELRANASSAGGAVASLRGGITALVAALEADVDRLGVRVHRGAAILRAEFVAGAWRLFGHADAPLRDADALLLAVPEERARAIIGLAPAGRAAHPVEVVAVAIDDPRLDEAPRGTGALVPRAEGPADDGGIRAKALTHVTAKWPDRAAGLPAGRHVLRLSYGRAGAAPETGGLDDAAVLRLALADASRILGVPLDPGAVRGTARHRWRMPAPAGEAADRGFPGGIEVAGDWVHGSGLASVVPGARAAASRIAEGLADPRPAHMPAGKRPAGTEQEVPA